MLYDRAILVLDALNSLREAGGFWPFVPLPPTEAWGTRRLQFGLSVKQLLQKHQRASLTNEESLVPNFKDQCLEGEAVAPFQGVH